MSASLRSTNSEATPKTSGRNRTAGQEPPRTLDESRAMHQETWSRELVLDQRFVELEDRPARNVQEEVVLILPVQAILRVVAHPESEPDDEQQRGQSSRREHPRDQPLHESEEFVNGG